MVWSSGQSRELPVRGVSGLFDCQRLCSDRPSVVFTEKVVFRSLSGALAKMQDSRRDPIQNKTDTGTGNGAGAPQRRVIPRQMACLR